MQLQDALDVTSQHLKLESFEHFRQHLDPAWIEMAIDDSGTWTLRQRRLPASSSPPPRSRRTRASCWRSWRLPLAYGGSAGSSVSGCPPSAWSPPP